MDEKTKTVNIRGLPLEVHSPEFIRDSGAMLLCMRASAARAPWDEHYVPGTTNGFACSLCGEDCILAPSGQEIAAYGKNAVMCMECFVFSEIVKKAN